MSTVFPSIRSRNDGLVVSVLVAVGAAGLLVGLAIAGLVYQSRLSAAEARARAMALALQQSQAMLVAAERVRAPAESASRPVSLASSTNVIALTQPAVKIASMPDQAKPKDAPVNHPTPERAVHSEMPNSVRDHTQERTAVNRATVAPSKPVVQPVPHDRTQEQAVNSAGESPKMPAQPLQAVSGDAGEANSPPPKLPAQPLQAVSAEAAGLRSMDAQGVVLSNGQRVTIGGYFPSGEKLLAVDPKDNEVITSRRTLVLFFGRPTHP